MPNDNIQRIIKRAEGGDKTGYEAITYEGYGPGGIAVMVETKANSRYADCIERYQKLCKSK